MAEPQFQCYFCGKIVDYDTSCTVAGDWIQCCHNCGDEYHEDNPGADEFQYGYPPAGLMPADFTPDHDLCTKEEIDRWQQDLAANEPHKSDTGWVFGVHILAPSWGIGHYRVRH